MVTLRNIILSIQCFMIVCAQAHDFLNDEDKVDPKLKKKLIALKNTEWSLSLHRAGEKAIRQHRELQSESASSTTDNCTPHLSEIWFDYKISEMGVGNFSALLNLDVESILYVAKIFVLADSVDYSDEDEYIGIDGVDTEEAMSSFCQLKSFWSKSDDDDEDGMKINTTNVVILGVHGKDLANNMNIVRALEMIAPSMTTSERLDYAQQVQELVSGLPGGYSNPLLTFNAVASLSEEYGGYGLNNVIAFGDGISQFFHNVKIEEGASFVVPHEFGHHLQREINYQDDYNQDETVDGQEVTRSELMADVYGSYFLAHQKGGDLPIQQIATSDAFSSLGDCDLDSSTHHGTGPQRKCASIWGAKLARNKILNPTIIEKRFTRNLNKILSLDSEVCSVE